MSQKHMTQDPPELSPDGATAGEPLPAFEAVYSELRHLAEAMLRRHGPSDTLNTTALIHEAYLRLHANDGEVRDRTHFFALAARAMRFVLVDYARARSAAKRGGPARPVTLQTAHDPVDLRADEVLALDEALTRLASERPRLAQVVELRFFAGLTYDEIAGFTGTSVRTAKRDWELARAWLHRTVHGT
jgi:RNA polymerase sigma factor (TIGR02999 family)